MLIALGALGVALYDATHTAGYSNREVCDIVAPLAAQQIAPDADPQALAAHQEAVAIVHQLNCK